MVIGGGQGSHKIVVSVFDGDMDPEISFAVQEGPGEKLTGANRLLIMAEVNGGQERHHNLRLLLERLALHTVPGLVQVGDLCVTNGYLGISKHGGKHSCCVCEEESALESGKLRTFGSLDYWYKLYTDNGSGGEK